MEIEQVPFLEGAHTLSAQRDLPVWLSYKAVDDEELERAANKMLRIIIKEKIISTQGVREGFKGKMAFKLWKIGRIWRAGWNGSDRGY